MLQAQGELHVQVSRGADMAGGKGAEHGASVPDPPPCCIRQPRSPAPPPPPGVRLPGTMPWRTSSPCERGPQHGVAAAAAMPPRGSSLALPASVTRVLLTPCLRPCFCSGLLPQACRATSQQAADALRGCVGERVPVRDGGAACQLSGASFLGANAAACQSQTILVLRARPGSCNHVLNPGIRKDRAAHTPQFLPTPTLIA